MSSAVYIVSTGARTPLGLESASSAAALRAALSAAGEHPFLIDQAGDPMPAALDARIDPEILGPRRLMMLARPALEEACSLLEEHPGWRHPVPLYLALPEYRPGFGEEDLAAVREAIGSLEGLPVELGDISAAPMGHAAGIAALVAATRQIASGRCPACLVGGVDTYFQPQTMEWLDANLQLVGSVSRSGFVPGEGAGFVMLMSAEACEQFGIPGLLRVSASGTSREPNLIKTVATCLGVGLTAAVQEVVSTVGAGAPPIETVICDINGERYRAEEWAFVCMRLGRHFVDPADYQSPADCWGDMGAASGPLFAMLACDMSARLPEQTSLIWASSEQGLRGAAILQPIPDGGRD